MMQKFAFLLLAASVALLGSVVPVEAALMVERETNGERLARGLSPLPPIKRSETETAKRRQVTPSWMPPTGRLEVRKVSDDSSLGNVANDRIRGPIGLNTFSDPTSAIVDLVVKFGASRLLVENNNFNAPYYIGGNGTNTLSPLNNNTIRFINVDFGPDAEIWTLDSTSGALNATSTNSDNTQVQLTLLYDAQLNALNFTANPQAFSDDKSQIPVNIFLTE